MKSESTQLLAVMGVLASVIDYPMYSLGIGKAPHRPVFKKLPHVAGVIVVGDLVNVFGREGIFRVVETYSLDDVERVKFRPYDDGPLVTRYVGPSDDRVDNLQPITRVEAPVQVPFKGLSEGVHQLPHSIGTVEVDSMGLPKSVTRSNKGVHKALAIEAAETFTGTCLDIADKYEDKAKLKMRVLGIGAGGHG